MKNILRYVLLCSISLGYMACERDDICLEEITPDLIIRFYDINNPGTLKTVLGLKVNIQGIEGEYTNGTITTFTDSIAIPMEVTQNTTHFILTLPSDDTTTLDINPDTITLSYTQEDIFISRSCGYKTIFNDVSATLVIDEDNWIKALETTTDPFQITDENEAHVKIYH